MPFVWGGAATNGASSGAADAEIAALFTSGGTTRNATAACPSKSLPGKPPKSKRRKVELEAADANLDWMGAAFGKGAGVQETDNHTTIDPLKVGNHEVKVFGLDPKTKKSHVRAAFTEFGDIRGVRLVGTSGSDHLTAIVTYGSKVEAEGAARNASGQEIRGHVVRTELVSGADVVDAKEAASTAHDGSALVMVSGLGDRATEQALRSHFSMCGKIRAVQLAVHKKTGEPKGMAYILFRKPAGALAALALHKADFGGSPARVALSSSARQIQRMISTNTPEKKLTPSDKGAAASTAGLGTKSKGKSGEKQGSQPRKSATKKRKKKDNATES